MLFAFSAGIVMVFLAGKSDMAEILKSTYRVFKQRSRVPARDLGNCIFFLLVFGSILALVFVSNVTLVALLGVRVGIVIFILALKAGLDRLRRKI